MKKDHIGLLVAFIIISALIAIVGINVLWIGKATNSDSLLIIGAILFLLGIGGVGTGKIIDIVISN